MATEREILITENDLDVLIELLNKEEKRCNANAIATKRGYGHAGSLEKNDKWSKRADDCNALAAKLSERFI